MTILGQLIVAALLVECGPPLLAGEPAADITFTKAQLDKLPPGWSAAQTGKGTGSVWKVTADPSAPSKSGHVLTQLAKGPTQLFNICVLDKSSFQNGEIQVMFKPLRGEIDQGGGIVWRYQDANNYYICRFNPLEENFRLYKVLGGQRLQLATKGFTVPEGWHNLAIRHKGKRITCLIDGKVLLVVEDDALPGAGKVGLWTKADAETSFDRLAIRKE